MLGMRMAVGLLTALAVCGSEALPVAAAQNTTQPADTFSKRLADAAPLSDEELAQLVDRTGTSVSGRVVRVREGAMVRQVTDVERQGAFAMLAGRLPVADAGTKTIEGVVVRGLRAPATPPVSEVDASQYLWVDVRTFLPMRFEVTFSVPGMGDGYVDFTYD